jgi:hypothetical protein
MEGGPACSPGDGEEEAEGQESDGADDVEETGTKSKPLRTGPPARPTMRRPAMGEPREGEQIQQ